MKISRNLISYSAVVLALLVATAATVPVQASTTAAAHIDPAAVLGSASQSLGAFEVLASVNPTSFGVAAVRALDASLSASPRYGSSLGVAAIRATDASAPLYNSLLGVAAVRAFDQGA